MKKFVCAALAGVAAIVASASPVDATVFTISYYGTANVQNPWSFIPGGGWQQNDVGYSVVFTIDNSKLNTESDIYDDFSQIWHIGPSSGVVSAVVTLDGIRSFALGNQSFSAYHLETHKELDDSGSDFHLLSDISDDGIIENFNNSGFDRQYHVSSRNYVELDLNLYADFDVLHPMEIDSNVEGRADLSFMVDSTRNGAIVGFGLQDFMGSAIINRVVVSLGTDTAPAVPEPATWAMMIGGFGLVGVAMRRRSKAVAALA